MFAVALLFIAAAAMAPEFAFQVKRDREEELIHRGVQYSRAIRRYYKKFGRYPTRIEELEKTNNIRFLRRRYKDPITGNDFKLLHMGEVQLSFGRGITGATSAAALAAAGGTEAIPNREMQQVAAILQMSPADLAVAGTSSPFSTNTTPASPLASGMNAQSGSQNAAESRSSPSSRVFGGGPILGVVSVSKGEAIREFNSKNHYNEWQFIYDPRNDRGGLLNTPNQRPLLNTGNQQLPQPIAPVTLDGGPSPPARQNPLAQEPPEQ